MLNLGSEPASSIPNKSSFVEGELLNLSSQTSSNLGIGGRGNGNGDLLEDLFQSSTETKSSTNPTFAPISAQANPFFTLDPFDPLVDATKDVSTPPNNLSSSNSFGNFATLQQSQPSDESLMGNWDSILKQTPSVGARPMTLPSIPRNSSTPNLETKAKDPLADFGNLIGLVGTASTTAKAPAWGPPTKTNPPMNIGNSKWVICFIFVLAFNFSVLGLTNPSGFSNLPPAASGPSVTSPSTSLSGSPLHKPQTGWQNTVQPQAVRPNLNCNTSTAMNTPQHSAKTPGEAQPDYSRTNFDSVFGRNDYGNHFLDFLN